MKAQLRSEAELWDVAVFAELAVWERRPELQLLCSIAQKRGALGPDDVDRVLPGLSGTARENLARHLTYLRLLDERGALTPLGRRCAETGEAPAWELGGYRFLVAVHSLFRCHLLGFMRVPGDRKDTDFQLERVPPWLRPDPDRVWTSAIDSAVRFTLQRLPAPPGAGADPRCRAEALRPATVVWQIDLESGQNAWHIEGELGSGRTFRSPPESVPAQELTGLLTAWDRRWSPNRRRVSMAYDGHATDGHDSFLRTFEYAGVEAGDRGTFREVVVEDVPVGPASSAEARSWARALAIARVAAADAYCPNDAWAKEWDAVVRGTPLDPGAGTAPAPDELDGNEEPFQARTRWLLRAANDLAME